MLTGIDLELAAGQTLALVGPSGCGKTTLLHLCAGLLPLQGGQLVHDFSRPAVMFQQPRLLPWQTVLDNIGLGLKATGMRQAPRQQRSRAIASAVGLDALALSQFPQALSGGMQSRAALARALVTEPDLLLMDEPFAALDIGLKAQLHRLLLTQQAARGLTVLLITHDLREALRLANRVLVMAADPGRFVHEWGSDTAPEARDESWVYRHTAALLQVPAVRHSFALEAAC